MDQDKFTIDRQARLITELRGVIADLQKTNEEQRQIIRNDSQAAYFYKALQKEILANPILQSEWTRFCSFLKLSDSELDKLKPLVHKEDIGSVWTIPYMF